MRDSNGVRNLRLLLHDHLALASLVSIVEGKLAREHLKHDNADCPPVGGESMAFPFEKLWSEVARRSCHIVRGLVHAEDSSHTEVNDLQIASLVQKQVLQFQVSVHNVAVMQVFYAQDKLNDVKLDLLFFELLLLFEKF